jgi:hypothetical protein
LALPQIVARHPRCDERLSFRPPWPTCPPAEAYRHFQALCVLGRLHRSHCRCIPQLTPFDNGMHWGDRNRLGLSGNALHRSNCHRTPAFRLMDRGSCSSRRHCFYPPVVRGSTVHRMNARSMRPFGGLGSLHDARLWVGRWPVHPCHRQAHELMMKLESSRPPVMISCANSCASTDQQVANATATEIT